MSAADRISVKRVYAADDDDGERVLVDRLWPRGVKKEALGARWLRDVAPSDELRRWAHATDDFPGFRQRYAEELASVAAAEAVEALLAIARAGRLTLLYAARDEARNNAVALRDHLLALLAEEA